MNIKPLFPTSLHQDAAEALRDYFLSVPHVDTVLVTNSCARGLAVPESDLDFAIVVKPGTSMSEIREMEADWQIYSHAQHHLSKFRQSGPYAHVHADIIDGRYTPGEIANGEPIDYFEIEIGNHIRYSAPMDEPGAYFNTLQSKWLPYYNEALRLQRMASSRKACRYNIDHIPFYVKRGLYFQAFDILCKAFQEYLQCLFITSRVYPIAYNKWIREQVTKHLDMPGLYPLLSPVISVSNIESVELNVKAGLLAQLLDSLPTQSIS